MKEAKHKRPHASWSRSYKRGNLQRQKLNQWLAVPGRTGQWVVTANGYGISFRGGENIQDLDSGPLACCDSWGRKESDTPERLNWMSTQFYKHTKKHKVYIFKQQMLWCMNCISKHKKVNGRNFKWQMITRILEKKWYKE